MEASLGNHAVTTWFVALDYDAAADHNDGDDDDVLRQTSWAQGLG